MGLLSKLFGSGKPDFYPVLENGVKMLRLGIFGRLSQEFTRGHGEQKAALLAVAVLESALVETPVSTEQATAFRLGNAKLIEREAERLHQDPAIAQALSYLYAALIINASIMERLPITARGSQLSERATQLQLDIPNTYDICGTGNARDCVFAVAQFAEQFVNSLERSVGR